MPVARSRKQGIEKAPTGIPGFDDITGGGLPRNRSTLVLGSPGAGKTIFALETLVNGARQGDSGIFIAFEENAKQIMENASTFGWDLAELEREKLFFLDAQLPSTIVTSGDFDLTGILAGLADKAGEMCCKRIVFDGLDVLLNLLNDPIKERREVYRLHEWLLESNTTGIITAKADGDRIASEKYAFMQFMVDCVVSMERISTGITRLDTMLDGGYYRVSSVLVTGAPGTTKTTLAGAFANAACERGEAVLYVSFDEAADQIVRNLSSVGMDLQQHRDAGLLHMYSIRTEVRSAEAHFIELKSLICDLKPRCMILDPISALAKTGGQIAAVHASLRLLDYAKADGITVFCTSLLSDADARAETTDTQISTIADTWIHLSYVVRGGERNRALTIVKSRGTKHSNQVRELILSDEGITLTDVFSAGGEVLMGTARWEKEDEVRDAELQRMAQSERARREMELAEADVAARIAALQRELEARRVELRLTGARDLTREQGQGTSQDTIARLRGGMGDTATDQARATDKYASPNKIG